MTQTHPSAAHPDAGRLQATPLLRDRDFLAQIEPPSGVAQVLEWAARNREEIRRLLLAHAGLLFRGVEIETADEFQRFIEATCDGELIEYRYGSTPRHVISGRIYTTTEYPADQTIPFHNEISYARSWPLKLWLFCQRPPAEGGETPLADSRRVYARIDPAIRDEFTRKGVLYVRNYGELIDVPWQKAFLTTDPAEVERYCDRHGIDWEWTGGGGLRTRQRGQAIARHPQTGERVWFNQAHLFHVSNLPEKRRERILRLFDEKDLPRNACFGDGSPIDPAMLDAIREAYRAEKVALPWVRGDLVMVDNMLAAHAREPFRGDRMIWIGMAEPHSAA